jgi:hypothetical protein
MNTSAPHVVMRIRAGLCLLFHVAQPLALGTCHLLAAHPPVASLEADFLSRALCKREESPNSNGSLIEISIAKRKRGTK